MVARCILLFFFLLLAFFNNPTQKAFQEKTQLASEFAYDLVIINGRIVDGTGNPWFRASIGIKDGRIVKIGKINPSSAKKVIDAKDNIVTPGFIDVHTHVENIFDLPKAENFIRMGVTSLITGNCGSSATDIAEFLGRYKEKPLTVNLGTLIGHGSVRAKVMGFDDRQPTPDEQAQMEAIVEKAMKDGALGLSTGLIYSPGTFAKTDEIVALAKIAARYGGVYASHIRDEGTEVVKAINEAIEIGEKAGIPVEISHFKISSKNLWGQSPVTIGLVKSAREKGLQVTVDQYVYTASSTSLEARLPNWAIAGGREETLKRLADKEMRSKIAQAMKEELEKRGFKDYSFAYVANYSPKPEYNGKNIVEITKLERGRDDLDAQIEQIFEMYEKGGASMVYRVMSEEDVRRILREPFTMFASDSGVRELGRGVPHPRGYGNNARVLGEYVRNLKLLSLEEAIRKMTSLPAQTFGIRDRGLLREGFFADIVIFDEKKVADRATFENPHQYPEGFIYVLVNGEVVLDENGLTDKRPGRAIVGSGKEIF
ncbi:MAG: D-aminoacylase [Acidobacteria bacterium]|nr:MAG: D-aminoacylase [Acidobacteriota bacterium]GIU83047.1 MAG: aminoacylase [Pyrinomonadaceae bacterium]